jgi:spermidine/putrescine transport system substrate-binding protein
VAAGAVALPGCDGDGDRRTADRLRILNWPDYIDPDGDDGTPGTVTRFAAERNLRVDYVEEYEGNAEAFAGVFEPTLGEGKPTGYDLAVPTYWAVQRMLERDWLEPIPIEAVPNHVNVDPAFLGMPWDRGARFHMPWQIGITGIAYDPAQVGGELRAVADLFRPALRGRIGMVTEMRETLGLLMLTQGADPSRATEAAGEDALDRLEQLAADGQVGRFTGSEFSDALRSGELAACFAWSGDIVQLQVDRPDIRFVIPTEGGIRWFDSMVIPKGAANPAGAAAWMDFAYDPENAARITQYVQYISPVLGVREALAAQGGEAAALADNPILFPDDATRRRLYFWGGLDSAAEDRLQARFEALTS